MKSYEEIEKIFDTKTPWTQFVVKDWLPEDIFNSLKKIILDSYADKDKAKYDPAYGRWFVEHMPFYEIPDFYDKVLFYAKKSLKEHDPNWDDYVSLGRFGWKYESVDGVIPSLMGHMDTNGGNTQFDVVIDSSFDWGLRIGDNLYAESLPNEAIVFNGQELWHDRPAWEEYSKNKNDYLVVEFFVFAPKSHWFLTHGPDYLEVSRAIQKIRGISSTEDTKEYSDLKDRVVSLYNAISITKELSLQTAEDSLCEQKKLSDELNKSNFSKPGEGL